MPAATQKVYTKKPKKSAQVFYWKIKILYLPTPSFWLFRVNFLSSSRHSKSDL